MPFATDTLRLTFEFLVLGDLHALRGVSRRFRNIASPRCLGSGAEAAPLFSLRFMDDCCLCAAWCTGAACARCLKCACHCAAGGAGWCTLCCRPRPPSWCATVVTASRYELRIFVRDVEDGSRTVVVPRARGAGAVLKLECL